MPETTLKQFQVNSNIQCSYINQEVTIKFELDPSDKDNNIRYTAVDNVDWISYLDTSRSGEIIAHIDEKLVFIHPVVKYRKFVDNLFLNLVYRHNLTDFIFLHILPS